MSTVSLSGKDTVHFGGLVLQDFADGDYTDLKFPNEIAAVKTGKNGNSIYAFNTMGFQVDVTIRVIRGSRDDKFLNGLVRQWTKDPAGFLLINAEMVKRAGDGRGRITYDTYVVSGGVPTRFPGAKGNSEGDTEQAVAIYEFKFTNNNRAIL